MTTLLGIAGSLRRGSLNRRLLVAARHELPPGISLRTWDGLAAVPPFDEDAEDGPEPVAVAELRAVIAAADGVLIATPEYNGSLPGQLKNALDWASRPYGAAALSGRPVGVVGAGPGTRRGRDRTGGPAPGARPRRCGGRRGPAAGGRGLPCLRRARPAARPGAPRRARPPPR